MGTYNTNDVTIIAVGPAYYAQYPCGTPLLIEGQAGSIIGVRKDSCPDCTYQIDLSEAGIRQVCGSLGSCQVTVTSLRED